VDGNAEDGRGCGEVAPAGRFGHFGGRFGQGVGQLSSPGLVVAVVVREVGFGEYSAAVAGPEAPTVVIQASPPGERP
jgi:hypothetical protein